MTLPSVYIARSDITEFLAGHYKGNASVTEKTKLINSMAQGLKKDLLEYELSRHDYHVPLNELKSTGSMSVREIGKKKVKEYYLKDLSLDWKTEGLTKPFYLTHSAMDQWLKSRANFQPSYSYWKSIRDYPEYNGIKIPLKLMLIDEVAQSRPQLVKIFREANFKFTNNRINEKSDSVVTGIVGNDYPIFYSDYKLVDQMDMVLHDAGINYKYGHSGKDSYGNVRFSWYFTDKDMIMDMSNDPDSILRAERRGNIQGNIYKSTGVSYKNNNSGRGTLEMNIFGLNFICINGLLWAFSNMITGGIEHYSTKGFVTDIIRRLITLPKSVEERFDIELPKPRSAQWYLNPDNTDYLYTDMAKATILNILTQNERMFERYKKVATLILEDWRYELIKLAKDYDLSQTMLERLITICVEDPTIKLPVPKIDGRNPEEKQKNPAEYTAIIDSITSVANYYESIGKTTNSMKLQMIGGQLLAQAKPKTAYQTITIKA